MLRDRVPTCYKAFNDAAGVLFPLKIEGDSGG